MKKGIYVSGIVLAALIFSFTTVNDKKVIVIDAAHGGKDNGATCGDVTEKKIVEAISNKIKLLNKEGKLEIVLVRERDEFITQEERVKKINELHPDLMISLHVNNSNDVLQNGMEATVSKDNNYYKVSLAKATGLTARITKDKPWTGNVKAGNLYVLKNSKCPAMVLELGYLSNENDKKYLVSEAGQNEIATNIVDYLKN